VELYIRSTVRAWPLEENCTAQSSTKLIYAYLQEMCMVWPSVQRTVCYRRQGVVTFWLTVHSTTKINVTESFNDISQVKTRVLGFCAW